MRFRRALVIGATLVLALTSFVTANQAVAASHKKISFKSTRFDYGEVEGNIIFYNRTVQVGGTVRSYPFSRCAAVVYTFYSGNTFLSRAARPDDGKYVCDGDTNSHGFDLPADVPGGATHVVIDLWTHTKGVSNYNKMSSKCPRTAPIGCETFGS